MQWASRSLRLFTQRKRKCWFDRLLTFAYDKLVADFVERGGRRRKMFERCNGDSTRCTFCLPAKRGVSGVLAVRLLRMRRVKYFAIGKHNSRRLSLKLHFSASISTLHTGVNMLAAGGKAITHS